MKPLDPRRLRTVSARGRTSRVELQRFARPVERTATLRAFYASLPRIEQGERLRRLAAATAQARARGRGVAWALGGHVIKVGCGPLLIDLMKRGAVTALVLNGAAAIHDFEIAFMGRTSEDVAPGVEAGTFGMAEETGAFFAAAAERGREAGLGAGLQRELRRHRAPHRRHSVIAAADRHGVPVTVHVALGTDIVHMHPACDGAAVGAASHRDFLLLAGLCAALHRGVFLNWGSAVVVPEVFVKAVTMQNNVRRRPLRITTANFDQLRHYRPRKNVVERPAAVGYDFTGHHELTMPLFRLALLQEMGA
ncbi:MAG: hypothetical protein ACE5JG_06050 [Planctomycetota bacterium]